MFQICLEMFDYGLIIKKLSKLFGHSLSIRIIYCQLLAKVINGDLANDYLWQYLVF